MKKAKEPQKAPRTCRVSSKNQVTIPVVALAETGIRAGDRLVVLADARAGWCSAWSGTRSQSSPER